MGHILLSRLILERGLLEAGQMCVLGQVHHAAHDTPLDNDPPLKPQRKGRHGASSFSNLPASVNGEGTGNNFRSATVTVTAFTPAFPY